MRLLFSLPNLATTPLSATTFTYPVPESTTSTLESPSSILSLARPVKLEPSKAGKAPVNCADGILVKLAPEQKKL